MIQIELVEILGLDFGNWVYIDDSRWTRSVRIFTFKMGFYLLFMSSGSNSNALEQQIRMTSYALDIFSD